ncbi:hypothetical protein HHL17_10575 [Chitinophaga sp. G-6-1-13]|uniref:Uncharacterized protein n=1 Tax=Chitinophaga fulva TaxID=2728842 RepID=A0A848GHH2_9BACT|nr:hypothetical protein [Chitinophaga fulva]NML37636.1 hypothetical protein [Chitinophaga fulva]
MNRLLLLFVLFFELTTGHDSAAMPKITTIDNRATFRFNVPYPYTDVDCCAVDLDDGSGRQGYRADWVYNARYATDG